MDYWVLFDAVDHDILLNVPLQFDICFSLNGPTFKIKHADNDFKEGLFSFEYENFEQTSRYLKRTFV